MKRRSFLGYFLLFLASCSATGHQSTKKLRFAVTDAVGIEELQEYEKFRATLEEVFGIPIEFFPVENIVATVPPMVAGDIDIVWAGPSEYLLLRSRAKAIPLVTIQRPTFHSVIIVRHDSELQTLADLQGKTIDMHRVGSTGSYTGPLKMLLNVGLSPKSDFKIVTPARHTLQGLKKGEVDALARPFHRYQTILQKEGENESNYRILAKGEKLPGDLLMASAQLNDELVEKLKFRTFKHQDKLIQSIVSVEALASKFKNTSFAIANDADYDIMRDVYQAIGQDEYLY